jgi:hypothetical protein
MSSTHRSLPHNHLPAAANSTGGSHSTTPLNPFQRLGSLGGGFYSRIISFRELHPPRALKVEVLRRVGRIPSRSKPSCSQQHHHPTPHLQACS